MTNVATPAVSGKGGRSRISRNIDPANNDRPAPDDRVWLWNPVGFDPGDCLPPDLRRHGDCARFFVHRIVYAGIADRRFREDYVPLKAQYMRKFFPSPDVYAGVREALITGGPVMSDDRFIVGKKCIGYRLAPGLAASPLRRVEVTDPKLAGKVRDRRAGWLNDLSPVHHYLIGHLRRLEIDADAATEWLLDNHEGDDHLSLDMASIQVFSGREFHGNACDDFGHRFHSPLTNLRKGLRAFLTCGGKPLVNLDIANSQPLIFGALLKQRYAGTPLPDDVVRYIELCQAGSFYEFLMEAAAVPPAGRERFKVKFFAHVFYCKTRHVTEAAEAFGRHFPNVFRVVREMREPDYKNLPRRLQRFESDLMIGKVAARLMAETPAVPVFTVHDAVLTTPDHASLVQSVMSEEFGKVGLQPTIKVEHLQTTQSIRQL